MKLKKKFLFLSLLSTTLMLQSCIAKKVDDNSNNNKEDIKEEQIKLESLNINDVTTAEANLDITFKDSDSIKNIEVFYFKIEDNVEHMQNFVFEKNDNFFSVKLKNLEENTDYLIFKIRVITNLDKEIFFQVNKTFKTQINNKDNLILLSQVPSESVKKIKLKVSSDKEINNLNDSEINIEYSAKQDNVLITKTRIINNFIYLDSSLNIGYAIKKIKLIDSDKTI